MVDQLTERWMVFCTPKKFMVHRAPECVDIQQNKNVTKKLIGK